MGRPEKSIVTENRALKKLATWLRDQRRRIGQPSYRQLAERAGCHPTRLQRAAAGTHVPPLSAVLAYAHSCDASPEEAKLLWKRARHEHTQLTRKGIGLVAPRLGLVRDFADLSAVLQVLYEKAGSPTLRTMEERAGGYGALPRSTAHRIVTRQTVPHSLKQFQAFLRACEVPAEEQSEWEAAWSRAWRHEKQDKLLDSEVFPSRWLAYGESNLRDFQASYPRSRDTDLIMRQLHQQESEMEETRSQYERKPDRVLQNLQRQTSTERHVRTPRRGHHVLRLPSVM